LFRPIFLRKLIADNNLRRRHTNLMGLIMLNFII